jgi:hypothetical protein
MYDYRFDHVHLRSANPSAMADFFETMFAADVARDIYPASTLYPARTFCIIPTTINELVAACGSMGIFPQPVPRGTARWDHPSETSSSNFFTPREGCHGNCTNWE